MFNLILARGFLLFTISSPFKLPIAANHRLSKARRNNEFDCKLSLPFLGGRLAVPFVKKGRGGEKGTNRGKNE